MLQVEHFDGWHLGVDDPVLGHAGEGIPLPLDDAVPFGVTRRDDLDGQRHGSANRVPDAVFVLDLNKEEIAVREARRLNLPVLGLVDTNCDPDDADLVIPGNDDAIRSCSLIVRVVAQAIADGQAKLTVAEARAKVKAEKAEKTKATDTSEAPSAE